MPAGGQLVHTGFDQAGLTPDFRLNNSITCCSDASAAAPAARSDAVAVARAKSTTGAADPVPAVSGSIAAITPRLGLAATARPQPDEEFGDRPAQFTRPRWKDGVYFAVLGSSPPAARG